MNNVSTMIPKGGLKSKQYLTELLREHGDDLRGVMIIGLLSDGQIIDGWSSEVPEEQSMKWLGALEQFKLDFWQTLFVTRKDLEE